MVFRSTIRPGGTLQVAEVAGHAHVADHRATDQGDLAPVGRRGVEDLLHAVHVARRSRRR